jgi:hypothetical protein
MNPLDQSSPETCFRAAGAPEAWIAVFAHRIEVSPTGCWLWTGALCCGYGILRRERKSWRASRLSWTLWHGPIPKGTGFHGTCACHHCDTRRCVRPVGKHIFLGSHTDNMRDMEAKGRGLHLAGDEHAYRLHPEMHASGDRNGSRTRPESRPRGSGHANAKLTELEVLEIRALRGKERQVDTAARYGVSQVLISVVQRGAGWRHVR